MTVVGSVPQSPESITASRAWPSWSAICHPWVMGSSWSGSSKVLSISRDRGPKAGGMKGSGFLSIENNDASAERMGHFLDEAGIDYWSTT